MKLCLLLLLVVPVVWAELPVEDAPAEIKPKPGIAVPSPTGGKPSAPVAKDGDMLRFRNNDTLHGTVLGVTATGVRWRHGDVKEAIAFGLDNVAELTLAPRPPRASRTVHRTVVELTNGDRLAGDIVSLNDKTLTLATWYAGTLTLRRPAVQHIAFSAAAPEAAYVGPTGIADWTRGDGNRGAWSFRKGALVSAGNGTIGRDVKLPDVANIELDLGWQGQLYIQIGFGFDQVRQIYNSGGYMLQFNYSNVFLQRFKPGQGNNNLGSNVEMQNLLRKSKTHISIRVNKPKKSIALFVDGQMVRQWNEPDEWAAKGSNLVLLSQGQGVCRVSNISVSEWDGHLDSDTATGSSSSEDLVRFNNNDKVSGNLQAIANNQITFATSFAEMKIPLERVATIDFAAPKAEKARRQATDVRAVFLDGSRFTLGLEKLDEAALAGSSENCGRVTSALDAFRSVQFHIYDQPTETEEKDDDAPAGGDDQ